VAVTDAEGYFYLTSSKSIDRMDLEIEAPDLARKKFFRVPTSRLVNLRLTEGATIAGRIWVDNLPLAHCAIGVNSVDNTDQGAGRFNTQTDAQGRFQIEHVTPYQDYHLYRVMPLGSEALEVNWKRVEVKGDNSRVDLGDVKVSSTPGPPPQ
jgi:hypothetical protein